MKEAKKLLGRETFEFAEEQAANQASNPEIQAGVLQNIQQLIDAGHIEPDGPTATIRGLAVRGCDVCMDDVAPFDR